MAKPTFKPFELVASGLGYPESPKPMPDGSVLLVDIKAEELIRVYPDADSPKTAKREVVAKVPGGPNGLAIGPDGHAYIANNGGFTWMPIPLPNGQEIFLGTVQAEDYTTGSIDRVNLDSGTVERVYHQFSKGMSMAGFGPRECKPVPYPAPNKLCGPDDLVFDRAGGFWISDWGKQRPRDKDVTSILYARPDGSDITEMVYPLDGPNGIALSPNEDRLYTTLTYSREVIYWKLGGPGQIIPNPDRMSGEYTLLAQLPGQAILDSMALDEAGNVYVAYMLPDGATPFSNGGIAVISPDGEMLDVLEIKLPNLFAPLPSSLCFGGPERKTMFVTCGASGLILRAECSIPGLKLNYQPYQ